MPRSRPSVCFIGRGVHLGGFFCQKIKVGKWALVIVFALFLGGVFVDYIFFEKITNKSCFVAT
jgi:hypothetical protein